MRVQLGKPDSVAGGAGSGFREKFREAVKAQAQSGSGFRFISFSTKSEKTILPTNSASQRGVRDRIVFIGVAQEKAKAFSGTKVNGQFRFNRDKTIYVNHYIISTLTTTISGPLFIKVCSYAPWGIKLCINGHEWAKRQLEKRKIGYDALDNGSPFLRRSPKSFSRSAIHWDRANRAAVPGNG